MSRVNAQKFLKKINGALWQLIGLEIAGEMIHHTAQDTLYIKNVEKPHMSLEIVWKAYEVKE